MKVLITGVSGTGKSTISKALKEKGVFSMDFNEVPDMCFWQDKQTKEIVDYTSIESREWFENKSRICDLGKLRQVLNQHKNIVMCGVASGNQAEYFPLFDKVILLQCNPKTFVHRMQTRTAKYGKTKAEQDDVVDWQKKFDPSLLSQGAIAVNNEGSLEQVVAKIREII